MTTNQIMLTNGFMETQNDVPELSPKMPHALALETPTFLDVFPANFFSLKKFEEEFKPLGVEDIVATPIGISRESVYNPEKDEKGERAEWKLCLNFAETETMLILNRSRAKRCMEITKSPHAHNWWKLGKIRIYPGLLYGKGQLTFDVVEPYSEKTLDDINDELFD